MSAAPFRVFKENINRQDYEESVKNIAKELRPAWDKDKINIKVSILDHPIINLSCKCVCVFFLNFFLYNLKCNQLMMYTMNLKL